MFDTLEEVVDLCLFDILNRTPLFEDSKPNSNFVRAFAHFPDKERVFNLILAIPPQDRALYSVLQFVDAYLDFSGEGRRVSKETLFLVGLPFYCEGRERFSSIWMNYYRLCHGKKPKYCVLSDRKYTQVQPLLAQYELLMFNAGLICSKGKSCIYTAESHPDQPIVQDWKKLIRAQIGIDVNHHIPVFDDLLNNKTINEIFEQAALYGGNRFSETVEQVKIRMVAIAVSVFNLCRWSQGSLAMADLIVNLTGSLITCAPIKVIQKAFSWLFAPSAQAGGVNVSLLAKAVLVIVFLVTASKLPGKHTCDEFFNRLNSIPRAMSGVESFWQKLDPIVKTATSYVDEHVFGFDMSHKARDYMEEVEKWAEEVAEYSDIYKRRLINRDVATLMGAGKIHVQGIRLLAKCTKLGYDRKNAELIRSLLATTYKISENALRSGADKCKVRQEPIIVWMNGDSGVGKSMVTYPFIIDMIKRTGDMPADDSWMQKIYARAPETEYWDGYTDQEYVVYDDAFQLKDSIANPSPELFEIIRLGNMFPYMLHMASIEEKANSFACPKFIFLSSNLNRIIAESIHCKEAVERRIQFAFNVTLKEEYRTYYMSNNQEKFQFNKGVKKDTIDLDAYNFQRFDPHTGKPYGPSGMDYKTAVSLVGDALSDSIDSFSDYDKWLREYAQKPMAQIGDVPLVEDPSAMDSMWNGVFAGQYLNPDYEFLSPKSGLLTTIGVGIRNAYQAATSVLPAIAKAWWTKSPIDHPALHNPAGHFSYRKYDHRFAEPPRQGLELHEILSQCGTEVLEPSWCRSVLKRWTTWKYDTFLPKYYSLRHNLPGLLIKALGVMGLGIVAYSWYRRACQVLDVNKSITMQSKNVSIDSITTAVGNAEKCSREGCEHCERCTEAEDEDSQLYHDYQDKMIYWGVPCVCYIDVCESQTRDNQKVFVAMLQSKMELPKVREEPTVQALVANFAQCVCDQCPICVEGECLCLRIARDRGVDVGENDLLDRCGIYSQFASRVQGKVTSPDGAKPSRHRGNRRIRVQAKIVPPDGAKKVEKQRNVRIQSVTPHEHTCIKCGVSYIHAHPMTFKDHRQFADQCPNEECVWYHKGDNPTDAQLVALQGVAQSKSCPAYDPAMLQVLESRIWPNVMRIYLAPKGEEKVFRHLGHVLALGGRLFLMNWHFTFVIGDYPEMDIVMRGPQLVFWRGSSGAILNECKRIPEKDACVFSLDYKGAMLPNIIKHFIPKSTRFSFETQTLTLARYRVMSEKMEMHPMTTNNATLQVEPITITAERRQGREAFEEYIVNPTSWTYGLATVNGDCGAPLIINNSMIPSKIVGIHNAAQEARGIAFGVPLYAEEIRSVVSGFDVKLQYGWSDLQEIATPEAMDFADGDNFVVVKCIPGSLPAPSRTCLAHSPIHGEFIETQTRPGYLRPFKDETGELIDPARMQRKKWGFHQPLINERIADRVDNAIVQLVNYTVKSVDEHYCRPLTTEEAIVGIPGIEHIGSINKMSSPGYPYILAKRPGKGKTGYFGHADFDLSLPGAREVIAKVDEMEQQILKNERPFVVWVDTLKDARIPIHKAEAGKTRIFSAGPVDYCILYRKYFLPHFASIMVNRVDNFMAPGINALSPEWHHLALKLKTKGSAVLAGDYSNYDGKACSRGYAATCKATVAWYFKYWDIVVREGRNVVQGQELDQAQFAYFLECIFQECITHVHVCEQIINEHRYHLFYQVCNGMPSGNPGTAIANSVCNAWMMLYCWFEMSEGTSLCSPESFFDSVYLCTYGDDIVVNVSDTVIDWYNQVTLTAAMLRNFDIEFTDEAKTGNIVKARTLSEVTFLKRNFVFNEYLQLYIGAMSTDILLDILNWVRTGSEDAKVITLSNLSGVAGELACHSREEFENYISKFKQCASKLASNTSIMPLFDTYHGYLDSIRNSEQQCVIVE